MQQAHADRRHALTFAAVTFSLLALGAGLQPRRPTAAPLPAAKPSVNAGTSLGRFVVTARWGHTAGPRQTAPQTTAIAAVDWSGSISIDCGALQDVEPLAFDAGAEADNIGSVVAEGSGSSVQFRSQTRQGWDGVRLVAVSCPESAERGATLIVRTAQRTIRSRLDWSADDFLALPAGHPGQTIELRIAAQLDPRSIRGSRLTSAERGIEWAALDR